MSMTAGAVSVAAGEVVTGTGLARALYDADVATLPLETAPTLGDTSAPYSAQRPASASDVALATAARLRALQERARLATAYAGALVPYLQANAKAKVAADATGDDVQAGTTHPAADKLLPIV